jgi:hypothetical protein
MTEEEAKLPATTAITGAIFMIAPQSAAYLRRLP